MVKRIAILFFLFVSLGFPKEWEYVSTLDGRVITWTKPKTNWTWTRKVYSRGGNEFDWVEFKDCEWQSRSVKINDNFTLGHQFKLYLNDNDYPETK